MSERTWPALLALLLAWTGVAIAADATPSPDEEYEKKINASQETTPLGSDFTGESVSLYDGSTTFSIIDVSLPGNNALPVQIGRRFKVEDRHGEGFLPGFGDWDLDLPRIQGVFLSDRGWKLADPSPYARCTSQALPDVATPGAIVGPRDVWQGTYLYIPGQGEQELLVNDQPKLPAITDGQTYPWVTANFARVRCLTQTATGYPGEAFVAVTADGVKYTFDYVVSRPTQSIRVSATSGTQQIGLARSRVSFLPTRVDDRFGNWVIYAYTGDKLTGISASDGRAITLAWNGDQIQTVVANGRTWTYTYTPVTGYAYAATLSQVLLPDLSKWTYSAVGTLKPLREAPPDGGQNTTCPFESDPRYDNGGYRLTVGHTSGAMVVFDFAYGRTYRTHTPIKQCRQPGQQAPTPYAAHYWDNYKLTGKTISGPGLVSQHWSYSQGAVSSSFYTTGTATDPCPTCQQDKIVTVTAPDGGYERYRYGVMYGLNDGKLLQVERGQGVASPLSSTVTQYVTTGEVPVQRFPDAVGTSRNLVYSFSNRLRPVKQTTITQDGVTFQSTIKAPNAVYDFDEFGRTLIQTKASTLPYNPTKVDATTYSDNLSKWVLGQVKTQSTNGIVSSETYFDPTTALPMWSKAFGKLQQTLSYTLTPNTDQTGTLATVKDGNNNVTSLSSWKRGIPQSIKYPATPEATEGAIQSALVNDSGWIESVTDENGYKTCYGYDAIGRVNKITYPSETQVEICDESAWNPTTITFNGGNSAAYGLPAGHWRQTTLTGNGRKILFLDALLRPVVEQTLDLGNVSNTTTEVIKRYDTGGHLEFQSYPMNTIGQVIYTDTTLKGAHTTYDALDRVKSVVQDSEVGPLTTTTEYLAGFQTRVTNPRGYQTLTGMYLAYDQPTYAWPGGINEPEGKFTEIYRDVFGKPTAVRRRNGDGSQSAWRFYVYRPDYQTLCKTIDPEAGVTVMDFDGAGNLGWSASGLSLTDAGNCNLEEAWTSGRLVGRAYDARNRLTTLAFPDGQGDQQWTYTADGLPSQITTWNDANSPTAINAYHYNKRRMVDGQGITQTGWYTWSAGYGYDGNGNLAVQTYPTGLTVAYAPNALGQATQAGSFATGVSYYPNGSVAQFTYGNGIVHTMQQNARQLPMRSRDLYGGSAVLDDSYDFDTNGNVAAISDGLAGARGNRTMTYDGLDRLTDATSPMYGTTGAHYTYDILDNLKTVEAPGRNQTYLYDAANRLTNVTNTVDGVSVIGLGYDVQGNVVNKNGQATLFDYGNRLRQVNYAGSMVDRYRYDGYGRRVSTIKPDGAFSLWQYSLAGQLMFSSTGPSNETTHEYVYLAGSLVATVEHAWPSNAITATRYQHTDALGSPVAVTSETGAVTERSEYEPYGALLNRPIHDGPGYTGHVSDAATGLSYMQQRYYDPGIGRFLSVDPVTAGQQHFNRYAYAYDNPYKFNDPDGRDPDPDQKAATEEQSQRKFTGQGFGGTGHDPNMKTNGENSVSRNTFTEGNAQQRYNAASKAVGKVKDKMEATPHRTAGQAANAFHNTMQPISSRYGVEISSDIDDGAGVCYLANTEVGLRFGTDGIGYTVEGGGSSPTVHAHPVFSDRGGSYFPFSNDDVSWSMAASAQSQYLSDPAGTYRLDLGTRQIENISGGN
jgi:RHS repeat-associated protein